MKKMLAFFSWVPGKVAEGRKGEYKPSIYPAWRTPANPAFIPLGARQIPNLVRKKSLPPFAGEGGRRPEGGEYKPGIYSAWRLHEPSIHPAWWWHRLRYRLFVRYVCRLHSSSANAISVAYSGFTARIGMKSVPADGNTSPIMLAPAPPPLRGRQSGTGAFSCL